MTVMMGADRLEEMHELLEQREAELQVVKEERRDKDAAINFLKMKIVTLQNQSKVHSSCGQANSEPMAPSEPDASFQIALQERDQRIAELETKLVQVCQETERSQRQVHRLSSGGAAWELEEARHRLAERDHEVERLRRSLEWQERETRRITESSAADLEEIKQLFFVRDREVAELKRAMESLENSGRDQQLEVELRREVEHGRRLTSQLQRAEEEAESLRQQLREARDEAAWLWRSLREQSQQQEEEDVVAAERVPPQTVASPAHPSASVLERSSPRGTTSGSQAPSRMQSQGAPPPAGAEAAAGDNSPATVVTAARPAPAKRAIEAEVTVAAAAKEVLSNQKQGAVPAERWELCEAADEGAGGARRSSSEDTRLETQIQRVEICTAEDAKIKTQVEKAEIRTKEDLEFVAGLDEVPATSENVEDSFLAETEASALDEAAPCIEEGDHGGTDEGSDLQPVCVTGGGALFNINFFDGDEDVAAKEAKKQRVARQIERRRQARGAAATATVVGPTVGQTPSAGSRAEPQARLRAEPGEELPEMQYVPSEAQEAEQSNIEEAWTYETPRDAIAPSHGDPLFSGEPLQLPLPSTSPGRNSPVMSARFDPGFMFSPTSIQSNMSPTSASEAGGKTPTLHSKFAGLRDEMKRRRSKNALSGGACQAADPTEMAEAVIAEANLQPPPSSSRSVGSEQASGPLSCANTSPSAPPVLNAAAVAAAVGSVAAASAAASRVLAGSGYTSAASRGASPPPPGSSPMATNGTTTPLHSARVTQKIGSSAAGHSPGERIITTTASTSAPPGAPAYDRLGSSSGGRPRGPPPPPIGAGVAQHSPQASSTSPAFYLALGGQTVPASPSGSAPAAPLSPGASQATSSARHQPQRIRSVPQESTSSSRSSAGGDLDRSRRVNLSLSARSVQIGTTANGLGGGGGSSRFPAGQADHAAAQRSARPSVDGQTGNDLEQSDSLHDAVVRFCMQRPASRYPLVRLSKGVYLYGNKKLVIAMHNEKLMVRIGGGFVHLESYLLDCDRTAPPASPAAMSQVHSAASHFEPAPRAGGVASGRGVLQGRRR